MEKTEKTGLKARLSAFREKHRSVYEFISYALLGLLASAAEMLAFAACNYWIFRPLKQVTFRWWIIDYTAGTGGGLGGFLAAAVSYLIGQVVNFIIQRKATFRANNNTAKSSVLYAVFITLLWFFQVYMIAVLMRAFEPVMGQGLGDSAAKVATMFLCFLISFPTNKFIIMRRTERSPQSPPPPQ